MTIETLLLDTAERQGILAMLLLFLIVRIEAILKKCLSQQYEVNSQMLVMIGDILCDKNDSEMCKRFDNFRADVEARLSKKHH